MMAMLMSEMHSRKIPDGGAAPWTYIDFSGGKPLYKMSEVNVKDRAIANRWWKYVRDGHRKTHLDGWPFYPYANAIASVHDQNIREGRKAEKDLPPFPNFVFHPSIPGLPEEAFYNPRVVSLGKDRPRQTDLSTFPFVAFPLDLPIPEKLEWWPSVAWLVRK